MCATMEGEIGLLHQQISLSQQDVNNPKTTEREDSDMADTRYNGSFENLDLSDLAGGAAPQPAPQQPVPPAQPARQQPAQSGDPFENDGNRQRGGWGKWVIIAVVAAAFVAVMAIWGIPAIQSHLDSPSNPDSSQSSTPTGTQDPAPSNSQSGENGNDDPAQSDGQGSATLSVAEQAALLDPWFDGIPEKNWETKTTAELGVDPTTPLGSFVKNFCVVLSDGTVIARGTSETGDSIPTIISDYTVPTEWNGSAVVIAENDFNTVLLVSKLPEDTNQDMSGAIWHFEAAESAYAYVSKGHTTPPAAE